jgi:hypothetical protein
LPLSRLSLSFSIDFELLNDLMRELFCLEVTFCFGLEFRQIYLHFKL